MRYAYSRTSYDPDTAYWRTEIYERWLDKDSLSHETWLYDGESVHKTEAIAELAGKTECVRRNRIEPIKQLQAKLWCCLWLAARAGVNSNQRWQYKLRAGYLRDEIMGLE